MNAIHLSGTEDWFSDITSAEMRSNKNRNKTYLSKTKPLLALRVRVGNDSVTTSLCKLI